MPTPPPPKILAWSYSRLADYESCPAKARYKHVDKLKEPSNEAMERGGRIHALAENFVRRRETEVPDELKTFAEEFKHLTTLKVAEAELEIALRADWSVTTWFSRDAWLRIKVDAFVMDGDKARVIDYKTGKRREEHAEQLELYAMGIFLTRSAIDRVGVELWYLDTGEHTVASFDREQLTGLMAKWQGKASPMLSDTIFAPNPGPACRWCFFKKENNGPCEF